MVRGVDGERGEWMVRGWMVREVNMRMVVRM